MVIVFDTNIYLAAMGLETGLCFEIFSIIKQKPAAFSLFISRAIRQELLAKTAGLINEGIIKRASFERFSVLMNAVTYEVEPKEKVKIVKRDPDDDKILECAAACQADLIITMDKDLLKLKSFRSTGIIHPKTFLYMLEKNPDKG